MTYTRFIPKEHLVTTKTITITWRAFDNEVDDPASKTITFDTDLDDLALCEQAFRDTNLYEGPLWDALQPLPAAGKNEQRKHTALSVIFDRGDWVTIDGRTYEVADLGFTRVEGK